MRAIFLMSAFVQAALVAEHLARVHAAATPGGAVRGVAVETPSADVRAQFRGRVVRVDDGFGGRRGRGDVMMGMMLQVGIGEGGGEGCRGAVGGMGGMVVGLEGGGGWEFRPRVIAVTIAVGGGGVGGRGVVRVQETRVMVAVDGVWGRRDG